MGSCIPLINHHNAPFWESVKYRYIALGPPFILIKFMSKIHISNQYLHTRPEISNKQNIVSIQECTMQKIQPFGRGSPRPRCCVRNDTEGPSNPSLCSKNGKTFPLLWLVQPAFPKLPLPPPHFTENSSLFQLPLKTDLMQNHQDSEILYKYIIHVVCLSLYILSVKYYRSTDVQMKTPFEVQHKQV